MNLLSKISFCLTLLLIFSCSTTKQSEKLEHITINSKDTIDTLAIPPDLTGLNTKDKYSFPKGSIRASEIKNKNNNGVLKTYEHMFLENQGTQKWLVIESNDVQKIWNDLKAFWVDVGFVIDKEEPQIGFMETKWAENRTNIPQDPIRKLFEKVGLGKVYSSSVMDKFIIRLENYDNKHSKITFSHKGQEEILTGRNKETSKWQSRPRDPNMEAQYLARFMLFLGANQNYVNESLKNNNVNKLYLAAIKNNTLVLNGNLSRNKYRLKNALERIGFHINNFDTANNIFNVTMITTNNINNKKNKLFGRKNNTINEYNKMNILVKMIPNDKDDNVNIVILNLDGTDFKESKTIIEELYQELN